MNVKQSYVEFLFVPPRSSLSKHSRWAEFLDPKEMGISTILTAGVMAAKPDAVAMACIPLVAPFSTPPVSLNDWISNKRARAFQRTLFGVCTLQGAIALWNFFSGNLVGGFFDTILSAVGMYSCTPNGVTTLPSFIVFAGFNGFMDFLQILQKFHGVPIYLLPFHFAVFRPTLLFVACYLAWKFHQELTASYHGYSSGEPQDSWFVKLFGSDAWGPPIGAEALQQNERATPDEPTFVPPNRPPFSPFGGSGFRLGT